MQLERSAGVLLHITSLPAEFSRRNETAKARDFGVGDIGPAARQFVDLLNAAGQKVWQVLPLGPTALGDSPYSCYSAFAGNPLLISIDDMVEDGFVTSAEVEDEFEIVSRSGSVGLADYDFARQVKLKLLSLAFTRFRESAKCAAVDEFEAFCVTNRSWLDDYALFAALREHFGNDNWCEWESGLANRELDSLNEWRENLTKEVEFAQFVQYLFFQQWDRLAAHANGKGILFFGDMPIFVAYGSADVWANQDRFQLNSKGRPTHVAGVPPDYFSKTGQLWGNPLYNWDAMEDAGYRWWVQRLQSAFEQFDLLRIDHFRGFEAYWSVPARNKTAVGGEWVKGPGTGPFDAAQKSLGTLEIVAEDLGLITEEVHQLREELEFPGMRVLQFGFDNDHDEFHRPNSYPENSVAYTGTHDNSTIISWYRSGTANKKRCELLEPWLEQQDQDLRLHQQLLSMVYASDARLAIAPMQDILGLDDKARMNLPGTAEGNWRWRLQKHDFDNEAVEQLAKLTRDSNR